MFYEKVNGLRLKAPQYDTPTNYTQPRTIQARRFKWLGHIFRMDDISLVVWRGFQPFSGNKHKRCRPKLR